MAGLHREAAAPEVDSLTSSYPHADDVARREGVPLVPAARFSPYCDLAVLERQPLLAQLIGPRLRDRRELVGPGQRRRAVPRARRLCAATMASGLEALGLRAEAGAAAKQREDDERVRCMRTHQFDRAPPSRTCAGRTAIPSQRRPPFTEKTPQLTESPAVRARGAPTVAACDGPRGCCSASPLAKRSRRGRPSRSSASPARSSWTAAPTRRRGRRRAAAAHAVHADASAARPTQRTEIRVAYDDETSTRRAGSTTPSPRGIRVNSLYRDRWNGDDAFAIYIDAFNDNHNAKWFGTTPAGMRFDQLVSDDGATLNEQLGRLLGREDDDHRRGLVRRGAHPLLDASASRPTDGRAVMGLTVTRLVSRTRRARDLPRHRSAVRVPPPSQRAGRRAARRAQPHAALRHAVRAGGRARGASPATSRRLARRPRASREVGRRPALSRSRAR